MLMEANHLVEAAVSELTEKEINRLTAAPHQFFYPDGKNFSFSTAPTNVQVEITAIARKVKWGDLFAAALVMSQGHDRFIRNLLREQTRLKKMGRALGDQSEQDLILNLVSPIGNIVLLGTGDSTFSGTAALVIDLGGDDVYVGKAGSAENINQGRIQSRFLRSQSEDGLG